VDPAALGRVFAFGSLILFRLLFSAKLTEFPGMENTRARAPGSTLIFSFECAPEAYQ
jgi:hypothetical protein